jgi:hypothetical protein
MPLDGEFNRQVDGRSHTSGVGFVSSHDIKRGSMIGTGAHNRKAERNVHCLIEREQLHRYQSLIVIHGDNGVVVAVAGAHEDGVGRVWAGGVDALIASH